MSPTGDLSRELEVAGRDPLRYLNRSLLDDENARRQARARIRGLRDLATVNAWISVEKSLERGPRSTVLDWLEERRDEVLELGIHDFDDWLQDVPKQETESVGSICRIIRETDDGYESVDPSTRGPRVTTQRPCLEAFLERRDERERDDVQEDAVGPEAVGREQAVSADGGRDACPECDAALVEHDVNGQSGLWCPDCTDWRGPKR